MRVFRDSEGVIIWGAVIWGAFVLVLCLIPAAVLLTVNNMAACSEDPICRAERDFKWDQKRRADQVAYDARLAELERTQ